MQTEAIILKSFDYQENHKIVKALSPNLGLISVFVGYANSKNSKNRAIAEPLSLVTLNLKIPTNPREGLYYLYSGEMLDFFYNSKTD